MKTLYLLSPKIKWRAFKLLNDKLVKGGGVEPKHIDKVLWEMIRDKKIYCWFCKDWPNDMGLGLKVPRNYNVKIITNA